MDPPSYGRGPNGELWKVEEHLSNLIRLAKDVLDEAKAGDELAGILLDELGDMLGKALANLAIVTNPDAFVIGGGVSKAGAVLTDAIEKHYKKYAFHACEDTKIELATLGNDAGIYGAAKLVL